MKIAVLTLIIGDDYSKTVSLATQSKKEYCLKHGYDFIIGNDDIYDKSRPIAWSKIKLIKKHILDYDYIFLSDADVVIMNSKTRLEDLVIKYFEKDTNLLLTRDQQNLNTGNMIMKCGVDMDKLMDNIYNQTDFIHSSWWEQSAFIYLFNSNKYIRDYTRVLEDSHILNAYIVKLPNLELPEKCKYRTGDFLIHLAGIDNKKTLKDFIDICIKIQNMEKDDNFNEYVTIVME
tara:strand:- start:1445 stop:2140 length:696 start_codon:yes stop_codon:yes gene_type:complete